MLNQPSSLILPKLHRLAVGQDENFLTGYLAHIISTYLEIDHHCAIALLRCICPVGLPVSDQDAASIEVETQFSTPFGTPDIVLRGLDSIVFIEAKVESPFGPDQLDRYQKALSKRDESQKTLGTLTRYAIAIEDGPADYNVRWYEVANTLSLISPETEVGEYLKNEFLGLLRYRGVTMDPVSWELEEGVRSFRSLVDMLGEALRLNGIQSSRSGAWDWQGYYIDNKHFFVGIYFNEPNVIWINSEVDLDAPMSKEPELGQIDDRRWNFKIDLATEQVYFFARSRASQLQFLERWVREAVEYGRSLIDGDEEVFN